MMEVRDYDNVWDAIADTRHEAASLKGRAVLMDALRHYIAAHDLTQAEAARLFGVTQPRISDLMRGKFSLFSLDALMNMAAAAGLEPEVRLKKKVA